MTIDNIRIVLVETTHPGNIGSTARAMKTMGLKQLYLVSPKHFPDQRATDLASGADDLLTTAVVTVSLKEALEGCQLVFVTSVRPRDIDLPVVIPKEAATLIQQQSGGMSIAIVFGREHAGLTNEEILHGHYRINIPTHPDYMSLNLSQAVQIVAYELRMTCTFSMTNGQNDSLKKLATTEEVEQFYTHLRELLVEIDFLKLSNPKRLLQRLRRLFNRAKLEYVEVKILRGILTHIRHSLKTRVTNG